MQQQIMPLCHHAIIHGKADRRPLDTLNIFRISHALVHNDGPIAQT